MISPQKPHRNPDLPAGFSLVELLVVIVIIAFIATLLVPAIGQLLASQRLTTGASAIGAQLALARQTAMTAHAPVEMHIYQMTDMSGATNFTAFRLFRLTNSAASTNITTIPISPLAQLPLGVSAVAQGNYSTLLTDTTQLVLTNMETVPGENTNSIPFRTLRFLPNGQADLAVTGANGGQPWTLTIAETRFATNGTPANFASFVVTPLTGKILTYRP